MNTLYNRLLIFSSEPVAQPSIDLRLEQHPYLLLETAPATPGEKNHRPHHLARLAPATPETPSLNTRTLSHPETWWFNTDERTLVKAETTIALTTIESLMLVQLVISECRVLSRDDLIQRIEKDPQRYSGLEMCLSRLQKKFKSAAQGERLVRSVRNRGYCLAQRIKLA